MTPPEIPILLLGDTEIGKSTFLSRLTLGPTGSNLPSHHLPPPTDDDDPIAFNIRMYNRPYRFHFHTTTHAALQPAVIILAYSIASPTSLENIRTRWKDVVDREVNYDERCPVILLGLMRDVRQKEDYDGRVRRMAGDGGEEEEVLNGRTVVYPQEALRVAQEMRCDRYCECSALTGEVFEDIARVAAMTTTEKGGKTPGTTCSVM